MHYEQIHSRRALSRLCNRLADEPLIAFDTEFVSEDRFRPELCLVQVATDTYRAVIDPLEVGDTAPFWQLLASPGRTVIAHAAREEIRFCLRLGGGPIAGLFDVQLAAGFIGLEYPASLGTLVSRLLGKTLSKGETRTDWRRRPLSEDQLEYAIQDVLYLPDMYRQISETVASLGRTAWVEEETELLQRAVEHAEKRENWRRVSGISGLDPRQLGCVRELWRWREEEARAQDQPPRRVLRDDLLVELARRKSADVRRIRHLRGMERRNLQPHYEAIAGAIHRALELGEDELPEKPHGHRRAQSPLLTQYLSTAIACICRQHRMAPAIVGNADDVRDLLAFELASGRRRGKEPALLRGWRGDVVGRSFRGLLAGTHALRVANPKSDLPLEFVALDRDAEPEGAGPRNSERGDGA